MNVCLSVPCYQCTHVTAPVDLTRCVASTIEPWCACSIRVAWQGTWTPLHADVLRSFSWSTNVAGRKRWRLLAPQHTHLLYDRFGREMAPSLTPGQDAGAQRTHLHGSV